MSQAISFTFRLHIKRLIIFQPENYFLETAGNDLQITAVRVLEQHACHLLMGNASKVTHNGLHFLPRVFSVVVESSRLRQV